ncbi:MAG: prepilin-type N-terminal cleavage/methylation domain-containing protein [Luteolibacter sp.]
MTSAVRTTNSRGGFTLLEIVMVLSIAAMVMAGAIGLMVYSSDERTLRDYSGQIELLAKRARTTAILQQTSYALEFRAGVVRMLPLAQAGADERKKIGGREIGGKIEQTPEDAERQINLKDGMNISIRRWNTDAWLTTGKNSVHIWRFDPDGLCEPISVRLSLDKSWQEDTYHPLTATILSSDLEVR